jgi:hypothetical protein
MKNKITKENALPAGVHCKVYSKRGSTTDFFPIIFMTSNHKVLSYIEYRAVRRLGGWGSIFRKTPDIGFASYIQFNPSTPVTIRQHHNHEADIREGGKNRSRRL